ncbi:MAG: protein kinase [Gemmataceae bacterium]|nr:protein kinase [Gemmataceae bacterium]MDW8243440.1 protein kinase [Thermogemmata sp.]
MPSDSIAGFLHQAQSQRLLFPEQIERLLQEPDWPQQGLEQFCEYLLERGVLTPYQAQALREGRGHELNVGGYPVIEALGPCPGGHAFKVLHPTLRLPLVMRRIRWEDAQLGEPAEVFFQRLRRWGQWQHPHVVAALDIGRTDDEIFIVLDPLADHADVQTLTAELGGPMPAPLAVDVLRALAATLRLLHEQGGCHGAICPAHLLLGPLRDKTLPDGSHRRRPSRDATIKLAELGLLPRLAPIRQQPPPLDRLAYLPPECLDDPSPTAAGDVYALGATLYFLLTARPPFKGDTPQAIIDAISTAPLKPLARLRPDAPEPLATLVERMLERDPVRRPSAAEVEQVAAELSTIVAPAISSQGPLPESPPHAAASLPPATDLADEAPPVAEPVSGRHLPVAIPVSAAPADRTSDWNETWSGHLAATAGQAPPRRARPLTDQERARSRRLFILGGLLHLTAVTLLLLWIFGAFSSSPAPEPDPAPKKEQKNQPPKTKRGLSTTGNHLLLWCPACLN